MLTTILIGQLVNWWINFNWPTE